MKALLINPENRSIEAIDVSSHGRAVIVGTADDGATLRDASTDIEDLGARIKYL
jgi:hypothetical protein